LYRVLTIEPVAIDQENDNVFTEKLQNTTWKKLQNGLPMNVLRRNDES